MRTTYDILSSYIRRPRTIVRSSRNYSRHATPILQFFDRHRIALAAHVQRQFADRFQTDRATRMHLQTLVASRDLEVRAGQGTGQANVYVLTERGLRNLRRRTDDPRADDRPTHRRRPAGSHTVHELLITECAVMLSEAIRQRPDLLLLWEERFGLIEHPTFRDVIPDYAFLFRHAQGLLASFVEVYSGEESATRIGRKLNAYATWSASPEAQEFLVDLYRRHGAHDPRPQFRLLLIVHDRTGHNDTVRLRQILRETLSLSRAMRQRIWAVTVGDLAIAPSIDAEIWHRVRDLDAHAADWETRSRRDQHRFLRSMLPQLPRHRLFPSMEVPPYGAPPPHSADRVDMPADAGLAARPDRRLSP